MREEEEEAKRKSHGCDHKEWLVISSSFQFPLHLFSLLALSLSLFFITTSFLHLLHFLSSKTLSLLVLPHSSIKEHQESFIHLLFSATKGSLHLSNLREVRTLSLSSQSSCFACVCVLITSWACKKDLATAYAYFYHVFNAFEFIFTFYFRKAKNTFNKTQEQTLLF